MTTATLPESVRAVPDDGDLDHIYCCDPMTALCGADIREAEDIAASIMGSPDLCPVCRAAADGPCGDPNCPVRTNGEER